MRSVVARALTLGVAAFAFAACSSGVAATRPPDAAYVSASQVRFVQARVDVPAGEEFLLYFENLENVLHNVNVADGSGTSVARGEVFMGPSGQILTVPALSAGTYKLLCDVHPEMHAELVAN